MLVWLRYLFCRKWCQCYLFDNDREKIRQLRDGSIPIYEPVWKAWSDLMSKKEASFETDIKSGADSSDVIFIAVGTPPGEMENADLKHSSVAEEIGKSYQIILLLLQKVLFCRTSEKSEKSSGNSWITQCKSDFRHGIHPEFWKRVRCGRLPEPERIVIGVDNEKRWDNEKALYAFRT